MADYSKIDPSRKIPLTYLLYEATKAPTRYVQAVILNAETRAVIATVNLTDNGDGDFSDYSKTPAGLSIRKNSFFEVITTVYKDSGYVTPDSLRYEVVKQTYFVIEDRGGAILGGREVGSSQDSKINLDELVKKIFGYNKLPSHKNKNSFAYKFIGLIDTTKKTEKDITDISQLNKEMVEGLEEVDNRIVAFAEIVVKGFKNIKIPDNEKDFDRVVGQIVNLNGSFNILGNHLAKIANEDFYEKVLETEVKLDEMIKSVSNSDNSKLLLDIKLEIGSFLQELETKIDELNEN